MRVAFNPHPVAITDLDRVTLASNLVITNQSIGVATSSQGFNGIGNSIYFQHQSWLSDYSLNGQMESSESVLKI
jgi:hypothetical protein